MLVDQRVIHGQYLRELSSHPAVFFFFSDCAQHFVHQPVEDLEVPGAACGGLDALDALDAVRLVYHGTYHLEVS